MQRHINTNPACLAAEREQAGLEQDLTSVAQYDEQEEENRYLQSVTRQEIENGAASEASAGSSLVRTETPTSSNPFLGPDTDLNDDVSEGVRSVGPINCY